MVDFTKQTNQTNNKISVVHTQKKKETQNEYMETY